MEELLYNDLTHAIIGAAIEVHKQLGPGFLEMVYERALAHEFALRHIPFARQSPIPVQYKDIKVGKYQADLIVDGKIILEIKAVAALTRAHEAQALHYLTATSSRLALLLNFGQSTLQIKRIIH
jgi:GxxExxY protein